MRYIDYMQLNPFQKFGYNFTQFFKKLPGNLKKFFTAIGMFFVNIFVGIGRGFANYFSRFVKGDIFVKLSYLIFGVGNIVKGQIVKGLLFLTAEVAYILYMISFGWQYISKFASLGDNEGGVIYDDMGFAIGQEEGDVSMIILLYSVLTIVLSIIAILVYIANTKSAYAVCEKVRNGEKPLGFIDELKELVDEKFHVSLLSIPCLLIGCFTILPLIFMILMAFTNFDKNHPMTGLFDWVGLDTFKSLVSLTESDGADKAATFLGLTKWTIVWAIFATFSNYILGMIVALMINKKGIKLKSLWRTLFVVVVAVPQFVTLLLMRQMLAENGAINLLIQALGAAEPIKFLNSSPLLARATVIIVNIWVGIPYTILITSGILMNIPADLYESATIDGAGPVKSFMKITLPYMLFVTTPYLITSFIGNINNFNVIFLLSAGGPSNVDYYQAGYTDILVTWLFNLSMNQRDYNLAAAIGILVFIVCASLSLITFNLTKSAKDEEAFS